MFRFFILSILVSFFGFECKEEKKPLLTGNEPVAVQDFIASFQLVEPTVNFTDSLLLQKGVDSLSISYNVFSQFVPDTVLVNLFGKKKIPKIFPLSRVEIKGQEIYLFVKLITAEQKILMVMCFDNENKFLASLPILNFDDQLATSQMGGIDKRFTIFKTIYLKKANGQMAEGREVYVFNADSKKFMLIMMDALDDKVRDIINPIDTLTRKNKFAADYVKDKMNFVSVRDGSQPGVINFFIHFEKNKGECIGELKGTAKFKNSRIAIFQQSGDPCVLQLTFTSHSVSLKEINACGSHRDVKCSFDGSYLRKSSRKK